MAEDYSWLTPGAEFGADLQSIPGCIEELEALNRGMAYLDHQFGRVVDELSDAEETWERVEAEAAKKVREDLPKAATATEVRLAIARHVDQRRGDREARDAVRLWRRRKEKVERWLRTLEKRLDTAQSARAGHEALGRYGGST